MCFHFSAEASLALFNKHGTIYILNNSKNGCAVAMKVSCNE